MIIGELDTRLSFRAGLPNETHRSGAVATPVCGGFAQ